MDLKEVNGSNHARHPWEETRFEFFQGVLQRDNLLGPTTKILDIGSGDAWFTSQLSANNDIPPVTCWDQRYTEASPSDLGIPPSTAQLCNSRPDERYDVILMLDVLEHVENDRTFLREAVAYNLRPGGRLLISVPAWEYLESEHDRWLEHFRRYVPKQFQSTIRMANLRPVKQGGLFHSLIVPRTLGVLKEKLLPRKTQDEPSLQWQAGPLFSKIVTSALRADNKLSVWASNFGIPLPGLSMWALCESSD